MYVARDPRRCLEIAAKVVAAPLFFDNLIVPARAGIKQIAREERISEKTIYFWKKILLEKGTLLYAELHPGRHSSGERENKLMLSKEEIGKLIEEHRISQSVIKLLVWIIGEELQPYRRFSASTKLRILEEQDSMKKLCRVSYTSFSLLTGIDDRTLRFWRSRYNPDEGVKSLDNLSTAPKKNAMKLNDEITREIVQFGSWWQRKRGRIKITEFSRAFRKRYFKLLVSHGRVNLDDKTIASYLKEAELYGFKKEKRTAKRGSFRYYFPGAQVLIDTCQIYLCGVRVYMIAVMEAFSRGIFYQTAFLKETKEAVVKSLTGSLKEAKDRGIKIISAVMDHGTPYKARETERFLRERSILRIFSPPYWPQGKAAIERYFETAQSFIYARPKEILKVLVKGLLRLVMKRVNLAKSLLSNWVKIIVISFFKVFLLSLREEYNARLKNSDEQLPSKDVQSAVKKVLEERAEKSSLKREIIEKLHSEFEIDVTKEKAIKFLSRYRRKAIESAAEALRRKLARGDLSPERRWLYLAKTAFNINDEKKQAETVHAERIIREEETRKKEREERAKVLREDRWRDEHPEEAILQSIDYYLLLCENSFSRNHYEKEIKELVRKVIRQNSSLTLSYEIDKILSKINGRNLKKLAKELDVSVPDDAVKEEAIRQVVSLIKETNSQHKGEAGSPVTLSQIIKFRRAPKTILQ